MSGEVVIEENSAIFRLLGIDKVLALKSSIKIPLSHIVNVSTEKADWNGFKQLKIGGTGLYGVVKDGRYLSKDGLLFYEMHHPDKCVTVTLKEELYKKIVFEVEDKYSTAEMIKNAI